MVISKYLWFYSFIQYHLSSIFLGCHWSMVMNSSMLFLLNLQDVIVSMPSYAIFSSMSPQAIPEWLVVAATQHSSIHPSSNTPPETLSSLRALKYTASTWLQASLGPRQNSHHCADKTLKLIFLHEICCIYIQISLKFIPKGPVNN